MLPIVWLPGGEADAREAVAWYRRVRTELGDQFALAIDATMDAIKENPLRFPVVYRNRRRAGLRRFPYGGPGRPHRRCGLLPRPARSADAGSHAKAQLSD